jgi:hypothetical protein
VPDTTKDEQANLSSGTGAGLLGFITYLIQKNEMVAATASALRTGCAKVLSIEGDPAAVDVRTADVDDIVRRYRNRWRGEIKEQSLDEYERRFRQATTMYRKWLNNDPDWLPKRRPASAPSASSKKSEGATSGQQETGKRSSGNGSAGHDVPPQPGMVTYPIVIRPGVQGRIVLPENLTKKEAQRVAAFVNALALDEQLAIAAGPTEAS